MGACHPKLRLPLSSLNRAGDRSVIIQEMVRMFPKKKLSETETTPETRNAAVSSDTEETVT